MRLNYYFLFAGICFFTPLSAQQTLAGIVVDAANGAPLSFVSVFLKSDQQYGVLTNERGEYRINLTEAQLTDHLVFSLLSYQTHEESLQQLDTAQTTLNLQMETAFVELAEIVVISDLGLRALVQRAVDAIPNNYGSGKYLLRAYAREYNIDDGAYSQTVESMLTIQDGPWEKPTSSRLPPPKVWASQHRISDYNGNGRERFRIYNKAQTSLLNGYNWGANAIRNQEIHWLAGFGDKSMEMMTFVNRGEYLDGVDTLVKIQYNIHSKNAEINSATAKAFSEYFSGEVLINKTNYAILRNTQGDPSGDYYKDALYQKVDGKYYLKQLSLFSQFKYNNRTQSHYYNEVLYVTDVITDSKKIRKFKKGKLLNRDLKVSAITTPYDPNFWERNEILRLIPAPEALQMELSKARSLDEQFRDNARRIKRDTMKKR